MPSLSGKHIRAIVACGLYAIPLLIVGSCHLSNINRDADLNVSRLGTWEADEGLYANNAINLVRYGTLITPHDLNMALYCPFLTLIQSCYFRICGISIFSSRIQGVLSFVLALLLLYFLWKRLKLIHVGLVSVYLISFNYMLFAYTRSSMAEAHAGLLFTLITYCLFYKTEQSISNRTAIVLGFISFFATFVKPTMLVMPAAVSIYLFASLLEKNDKQTRIAIMKRFAVFAGTYCGLVVLLYLFLVLPNKTAWQFSTDPIRSVKFLGFAFLNLFQLVKTIILDPWDSLPFLLAASSVPILIRNYSNRRIDILDKLQVWCWSILLMQVVFVGAISYQPSRYYVAIIWPLGLINATYFYRLATTYWENQKNWFATAYRYVPIFVGIISFYITGSTPLMCIDLMLIALVIAVSLLNRQKAAVLVYSAVFILLPIGSFSASYENWVNTAKHSFFEALIDIGSKIPDNCIIMGRMAPFVALTHRCRAYVDPAVLDGRNKSPDYVILNGGLEEMEKWVRTNGKALDYLKYGWDESFTPLKYRIMGNYYSHKNTIVLKVKKSL